MIAEPEPVALKVEGTHVLVTVPSEVDVFTAPGLRAALIEAVASDRPGLVVDLSEVTFMDSSGLGVLVGGLKRATAGGIWMRLVCPHERILRLFAITGLTKVFDLYPTTDDALDRPHVPDPTESPEA
jgi:anti-sigma B factor antagonist